MARTFICGFEGNETASRAGTSVTIDGGLPTGTGVTYDTAIVRTGARSLKVSPSSGVAGYWDTSSNFSTGYARFYLRVTALPSGTPRIIVGSASTINLRLGVDGELRYHNGATLISSSSSRLTDPSAWYCIEFRQANGSSVVILRINGQDEITGSPSSWSAPQTIGANDTVADTYTAYIDDLVVDDTGFPGDGSVALLVPTADDTVTNWRRGGGTTATNLYLAVSSLPPGGLASASETDTSNIECASSTGTATYIATLESYESKGIKPNDTINAIRLICEHGEDIATGTKTGTVELTQNPVVAALTLGTTGSAAFGRDQGAHGAYADTTAAMLWVNSVTSTNYVQTPSVTVQTAPKMKLVKTDTTTRIACVCFMGMYVDYTPYRSEYQREDNRPAGASFAVARSTRY